MENKNLAEIIMDNTEKVMLIRKMFNTTELQSIRKFMEDFFFENSNKESVMPETEAEKFYLLLQQCLHSPYCTTRAALAGVMEALRDFHLKDCLTSLQLDSDGMVENWSLHPSVSEITNKVKNNPSLLSKYLMLSGLTEDKFNDIVSVLMSNPSPTESFAILSKYEEEIKLLILLSNIENTVDDEDASDEGISLLMLKLSKEIYINYPDLCKRVESLCNGRHEIMKMIMFLKQFVENEHDEALVTENPQYSHINMVK